ncbi:unnamed protein product [Cylindrotheca closterium]|uniref:Uncharacterized protein n=1 Tax=Cylindrotheca closterium TaxID=2856 RepID=A0AAD2JHG5_9STRA|nr:unnamed protein product [Cylindrotheca closterium]
MRGYSVQSHYTSGNAILIPTRRDILDVLEHPHRFDPDTIEVEVYLSNEDKYILKRNLRKIADVTRQNIGCRNAFVLAMKPTETLRSFIEPNESRNP